MESTRRRSRNSPSPPPPPPPPPPPVHPYYAGLAIVVGTGVVILYYVLSKW